MTTIESHVFWVCPTNWTQLQRKKESVLSSSITEDKDIISLILLKSETSKLPGDHSAMIQTLYSPGASVDSRVPLELESVKDKILASYLLSD